MDRDTYIQMQLAQTKHQLEVARKAEVETRIAYQRLQHYTAALEQIVQLVADFDDRDVCPNCERTPQRPHDPKCRVTKARQLLNKDSKDGTE